MKPHTWFFRPRTIWCPTFAGWALILGLLVTPFITWWTWGESLLCITQREPTEILVVEGWVGPETLEAAAAEFSTGSYRYIIATGGPDGERWSRKRWTYAEIAEDDLKAAGVPRAKIIVAPCRDVETQRTYESALAVQQALTTHNLHPTAVNIFTLGSHARRSRLVFSKVFEPEIKVGIISWLPPGARTEPWWHSTTRAKALLTETIGWVFEAFLDSARPANRQTPNPAQTSRRH